MALVEVQSPSTLSQSLSHVTFVLKIKLETLCILSVLGSLVMVGSRLETV